MGTPTLGSTSQKANTCFAGAAAKFGLGINDEKVRNSKQADAKVHLTAEKGKCKTRLYLKKKKMAKGGNIWEEKE